VEEEHRHSDRDLADGPASSNHCVQQLLSKAEKRRVDDGGSGVLISEKRWNGEKEMCGGGGRPMECRWTTTRGIKIGGGRRLGWLYSYKRGRRGERKQQPMN
jgi:hypothetical protein